jgi:hypothetical protein
LGLAWCIIVPRKRTWRWVWRRKTWATLVIEEVAMNYQFEVDRFDKETMKDLEAEVRAKRAQIEDEVVDGQVGDIILDLGCTGNMDTKFHCMVEL